MDTQELQKQFDLLVSKQDGIAKDFDAAIKELDFLRVTIGAQEMNLKRFKKLLDESKEKTAISELQEPQQLTIDEATVAVKTDADQKESHSNSKNIKKVFATNLKYYMKVKGVNAIELSKRVGVSESTIGRYLNLVHSPSDDSISRIANALGCTVSMLYSQSDSRKLTDFGINMMHALQEKAMTQQDLALKLKVSNFTVHGYKYKKVTLDDAIKIAGALDVPVSKLLKGVKP